MDYLTFQTNTVWQKAVWVCRLCEKYTRSEWACLYSSGYALEYTIPRLCQKYTCTEWAWLCTSGYAL